MRFSFSNSLLLVVACATLAAAASGQESSPAPSVSAPPTADLDTDCDVDLDDYAQMQRMFTGPLQGCCLRNLDCLDLEFCRRDGDCRGFGECAPRPVDCPRILEPVCGCDGRTYENRCFAAEGGASVRHDGPSEVAICELPAEIGPCDAVIPRYYFNPQTATCERFIWGGCGGNANNFSTIEACQRVCGQ